MTLNMRKTTTEVMSLFRNIGSINHTIQVTSFGGVGTTMLYRFLKSQNVNIPADHPNWRPWKHLLVPPADSEVKDGFRVVYVFGNPMDAVLSVFRRGYQKWHIDNMREDINGPADDAWQLDDFLQESKDPFRMAQHFRTWKEANRSYPILYLKFDALWRHLPEFFAFVGLSTESLDDFPEQRERASDWTEETEYVRRRLKKFYGELWSEIQTAPDFQIR